MPIMTIVLKFLAWTLRHFRQMRQIGKISRFLPVLGQLLAEKKVFVSFFRSFDFSAERDYKSPTGTRILRHSLNRK